jgi:hypothetical protein
MAKKKDWIDLAEIEKLAQIGLTQEETAGCMQVSRCTWFEAIANGRTDVLDAYKRGKAAHARMIIGTLAKIANEGNPQALIFLSKAHLNRRENINLLVQGDADNPVTVNVNVTELTPEQRQARIDELLAKKKARESK